MEELFYRYNPWWEDEFRLSGVVERLIPLQRLEQSLNKKEVVFITGLRRVGKSTLMKLLIKKMIEANSVKPEHIFYISLDDYRLTRKTILEIVEEYRRVHSLSFRQKV